MTSVELFAGAGGLALGMANAGFDHVAVVEKDANACATFRENQHRHGAKPWPLYEGDVRLFDYSNLEDVVVVSGGPPCQPFSIGGKHQGYSDGRDMFPEAVRAVRMLRPKAFIFENVRGLLRQSFASYFEYVLLQLTHPDIARHEPESWADHRVRLERHHTSQHNHVGYNVVFRRVNAADYGVPQRRDRVFLVGFRSDLDVQWSFPEGNFSEDALLRSKWITGEYWDKHKVAKRRRSQPTTRQAARVDKLRNGSLFGLEQRPWRTVRDAISDLPDPERNPLNGVPNHSFNPGARSYVGHTGSPLDEPAKTLKAGDHGVPGGENMLLHPDGAVRYFTVREAARLQTFPDNHVFSGPWSEAMRQLGNAVPVRLAEAVALSVADTLAGSEKESRGHRTL